MDFTIRSDFRSVEDAVMSLFGEGGRIAESVRISGGDVNEAYRLTLADGKHVFMKSNTKERAECFAAETRGLLAIAGTGAIGTPKVLGGGVDDKRKCSFLLMEFIGSGKRIPGYWEDFAHRLAAMHRAPTEDLTAGGRYGFARDNYIGIRRQINTAHESWITFYRDCRLAPQFESASGYFDGAERRRITKLLDKIGDILTEPEYPSLLHGDLWAGNFITGGDGRAWLIDPAAYVGHAEAEIAMTELFGGFPRVFYDAYREAAPLEPGYERRRDLYNLYHLLNHLNMFGGTYLLPVKRIVERYIP